MFGASPASKAARLMSSRSASKRAGTSNAKPAVTTAPGSGIAPGANVTTPVVSSTLKSMPASFSTPAIATRTLAATG